jgi:hypothetical protein
VPAGFRAPPPRLYGHTVRRTAALLRPVALLTLCLTGCSGGHPPASAPGPTYRLPGRPVRDGETPLPYRPVTDGRVTFAPIGLRTGMSFVVGSHADWPAKGQFVRVRVQAENGYATFHTIDMAKQLLVTADGTTHTVDENAMRIERQPAEAELGAHDRLEFDLIYDIPKQATAKALRLHGDPTDELGVVRAHDPGVEAPLG